MKGSFFSTHSGSFRLPSCTRKLPATSSGTGGAVMILESDPTCLRLFPRRFLKKVTLLAQPEQVVLGRRVKAGPQFPPVLETFCIPTVPWGLSVQQRRVLGRELGSSSQSPSSHFRSSWLRAPSRIDGFDLLSRPGRIRDPVATVHVWEVIFLGWGLRGVRSCPSQFLCK